MKFRRIPRPTGAVREIPDLIRLRFFRTNWGSERYIIEALRGDRCLVTEPSRHERTPWPSDECARNGTARSSSTRAAANMAQGGKKPQFAAMPKRAISDVRLTDRDFRNLAAIASHDRLSSVRGTGQGAWASHATMAAEVGTEYSRFSVSVNKMLVLGYLARERLGTDRRKFTYRVIYTDEDHLPLGKGSEQPNVVPAANLPDEVLCSSANEAGEIVCSDPELTHSDYIETPPQYISLSEEIDSVETGEIDSVETAHLKVRRLSSKIWIDDNVGARLAMFERAFRADPQAFTDEQLLEQHDWLRSLTEDVNPDDPNYHRASRLYYNLEYYLWESGITSDEEAAA